MSAKLEMLTAEGGFSDKHEIIPNDCLNESGGNVGMAGMRL